MPETDVYAVGVLRRLHTIRRALTVRHPALTGARWGIVRGEVRQQWRLWNRWAADRNWRAIRNSFNGYLAEHQHGGHNAGSGWTKRAARRRVERICEATA